MSKPGYCKAKTPMLMSHALVCNNDLIKRHVDSFQAKVRFPKSECTSFFIFLSQVKFDSLSTYCIIINVLLGCVSLKKNGGKWMFFGF